MPMMFQPKPGAVVMCDFRGFEEPEMIKLRPVVILSRNSRNSQLVTVVPLSTTEPIPAQKHHVNFISPAGNEPECWAKCDMVCTVSIARLDRIKTRNRATGKREYAVVPVSPEVFAAIQEGVRSALQL